MPKIHHTIQENKDEIITKVKKIKQSDPEISLTTLSRRFNMHPDTLRKWIREDEQNVNSKTR